MRTQWVLGGLALSFALFASAGADEPTSKGPTPAAEPLKPPLDQMLHRYLLDQARQQFEARRMAIAAIKTPEDISRRQKDQIGRAHV